MAEHRRGLEPGPLQGNGFIAAFLGRFTQVMRHAVKPVFIGDTIRSRVEVTATEPMVNRPCHGRVTERLTVTKHTGETALVADHIYMVERRP